MQVLCLLTCVLVWNSVTHGLSSGLSFPNNEVGSSGLKQDVYVKTNPCSRVGGDPTNPAHLTIDSDRKFYIGLPKGLSPGSYRCEWRITLESRKTPTNGAAETVEAGLTIELAPYYTTTIRSDFFGYVSVDVPSIEFSSGRYAMGRYTYKDAITTPNNTVIILEGTVESNDDTDKYLYFAQISQSSEALDFPKRFKVNDIVRKTKFIRNHRFTWWQARRYCKSLQMDLCDGNDRYTCNGRTPFSHADPNVSPQYFPILQHNTWVTVTNTSIGSCSAYLMGPPLWGLRGTLCPGNGCKSKSYIHCCKPNKQFRLHKYDPRIQYVSSMRNSNATVYYRFAETEDSNAFDVDEHYYDYVNWGDVWKITGRIPGDIKKFIMSQSYSRRTPTVIYFCEKIITDPNSHRALANYRFMVDLKPCKSPWKYIRHGYVSKKRKKGLTALYVGQSIKGYGSRISATPPCCGYTDSQRDFIVYAKIKEGWIRKDKPAVCGRALIGNATLNITKFESKIVLKNVKPPLYCVWRIDTSPGKAIHINYTFELGRGISIHDPNNPNYLRWTNPSSGRIFAETYGSASFTSDDNSVEITLAVEEENYSPKFSVEFYAVDIPSLKLMAFKVDETNATWLSTRTLCQNNSLELCTHKDVCPTGKLPNRGLMNCWLPVSDRFNEWIGTGSRSFFHDCDFISKSESRPVWKGMNGYASTFPVCSEVYCCDRPKVNLPDWTPVRVHVGFNNKFGGVYLFNITNTWEPPMYRYDYQDPYHNDYFTDMFPWRPPSTLNGSIPNAVDYFTLSREFMEGSFDQVVYFCSKDVSWNGAPYQYIYMATLTTCRTPWSYAFHLYAGSKKSEHAPELLTFGNTYYDDEAACCKNNPSNFSIFVVDSGQVESYTHPDTDYDGYTYHYLS